MSAVDTSELHGAEIVDRVLLIEVDQIDEGERIRAVDPVWADAVGHMMSRDGQKKDIEVCRLPGSKRFTIVDGAHRLAGARLHGLIYLRAQLVSANLQERRLREIMAQLGHRGLTDPLDRAAFVAELVQLKRAQAGLTATAERDAKVKAALRGRVMETISMTSSVKRAVRIEADLTMDTMSNVYGWSDEVGAELGLTGRTIRNDLMLYRGIAPSLIAKLREVRHIVLRNAAQLKLLARLNDEEQRQTVNTLLAYPGLTSIGQARTQITGGGKANDPEAKRLSAFTGAFSRMELSEKKAALAELLQQLTPGMREELADLLDPLLPEVEPTPAEIAGELDRTANMLRDYLDAGTDPIFLLQELQGDGEEPIVTPTDDGFILMVDGVAATSAAEGEPLLRAWIAAADARLAGETA